MEIERWSNQRSVRSLSDGDLGGRRASVDRTEAGWSRPGEPTPRWRSLLDRALLGGRTEASADVDRYGYAAPAPGRDDAQVKLATSAQGAGSTRVGRCDGPAPVCSATAGVAAPSEPARPITSNTAARRRE